MGKLTDKVAIVTGGSGGIGAATTRLFADEGARVMVVDLDEAALAALVDEVGADKLAYTVCDVSDPTQVEAYVAATVERFGGIDIAVLNAGIEGRVGSIVDTPTELFDRVMSVNVRGVWLGLKHVIPHMEARGGGSVVITSSIAGVRGRPHIAPYSTSKHAVVGLMRSAALELGEKNIRVNTVNPSPIETRMMRSLEQGFNPDDPDKFRTDYAASSPIGRYGEPDEVAKMMLFLASDDSAYCSGSVFMVDSGRHAR
jgi:NAD(P)-dependent dehydrogenase (short-subunit alcohol dehydrogenase family)